MAAEENKAVVQRFNELVGEVFRMGNVDALDEVLAPELVYHQPEAPADLQSYKRFFAMFRLACPDMRSTVEDMIAEGDKVVDRLTWHAPHQGEFMGIPPTGRAVRQAHMHFVHFRDCKAIEHLGLRDDLGMMRQMGLVPEPGRSEEASPT